MRGWGLLAAGVVALVLTQVFRRQELAYAACFLIALPVIALGWVALRRVAITVRRRLDPESGAVNQAVTTTVFLQNWGGFRSPSALWTDSASEPLEATEPAPLPPLPAFSATATDEPATQTVRYRLDTRYRGVHELGPFTVVLSDPFGCALRRHTIGGTDTALVTPMVFELARIDLRLSTGDGAEQVSRRLVGAGEQDVIARKYLAGDSMRRVHWPATAKHGELMVRQDDQRNDQDAVIVLDAHSFEESSDGRARAAARAARAAARALSRADDGPDEAFEWAVSAVASIALHLMGEGYGVRLVGHDARAAGVAPHDEVFTAPHGASRVVRDLAHASADALHDPIDFRVAVEEAALTSPDAPPVFALVSTRGGAADRIRDLAAMSSHPVAFVIDPGVEPGTGGAPGVDRRRPAAARRPETASSSVAAELRAAGWTAVDCRPGDSLPALWKALGEARGLS